MMKHASYPYVAIHSKCFNTTLGRTLEKNLAYDPSGIITSDSFNSASSYSSVVGYISIFAFAWVGAEANQWIHLMWILKNDIRIRNINKERFKTWAWTDLLIGLLNLVTREDTTTTKRRMMNSCMFWSWKWEWGGVYVGEGWVFWWIERVKIL